MFRALTAAVTGFLLLAFAGRTLAGEELIQLPTRPGVTVPFWLTSPADAPVASVVLLPGGNGLLYSARKPEPSSRNFLVRSRDKFAAAGFLVASLDGPSDHPEGLASFRDTAEHAQDIAAVIAYLRQKAAVPVWIIGDSASTISVANVATRLRSGGPDGLVFVSSIVAATRQAPSIQGMFDFGAIALPTLFVHNKEDACAASPFGAVPSFMARFTSTPRKQLIAVSGGIPPQSDPCEALSRHGYFGIEDEVVTAIADWIKES
jgi:hypothetical protein